MKKLINLKYKKRAYKLNSLKFPLDFQEERINEEKKQFQIRMQQETKISVNLNVVILHYWVLKEIPG